MSYGLEDSWHHILNKINFAWQPPHRPRSYDNKAFKSKSYFTKVVLSVNFSMRQQINDKSHPYSVFYPQPTNQAWVVKRHSSVEDTCHPFKSICLFGWGGCVQRANLMLHYANWSSQLTITLLIGQSDELAAGERLWKHVKEAKSPACWKWEVGDLKQNVKSHRQLWPVKHEGEEWQEVNGCHLLPSLAAGRRPSAFIFSSRENALAQVNFHFFQIHIHSRCAFPLCFHGPCG